MASKPTSKLRSPSSLAQAKVEKLRSRANSNKTRAPARQLHSLASLPIKRLTGSLSLSSSFWSHFRTQVSCLCELVSLSLALALYLTHTHTHKWLELKAKVKTTFWIRSLQGTIELGEFWSLGLGNERKAELGYRASERATGIVIEASEPESRSRPRYAITMHDRGLAKSANQTQTNTHTALAEQQARSQDTGDSLARLELPTQSGGSN